MALITGSCYGQPLYVPAAPVLSLPYGLFSVSNMIEEADVHWQQGVEWISEPGCTAARVYACPTCAQNNGNTAPAKTYDHGVQVVQALPFTVYASFACSPVGFWEDGFERARVGLQNAEERAVEQEISLGTSHNGNALAGAGTVNVSPTPGTSVSIPQGIAILEQYIGANGSGGGVILMTRREASLASGNHMVAPVGNQLQTKLGTPVGAMSGYTGVTGPNGVVAAAGTAWMFAVEPPQIRRSEIFTMPDIREHALSPRTNDFNVLAERTYAINWDCFTVGVLVANGTNLNAFTGSTLTEL